MEMSIDEAKQLLSQYQKLFNSLNGDYRLSRVQSSELSHSIGTALDVMRRYQMIELDHKAEMVGMLEKLQLEIEELDSRAGYSGDGMPTFSTDYIRKKKVNELIQQKIDALKGEQA